MAKTPEDPGWEELNIIVDEEYADLISNILADLVPGCLASERLYGEIFPHELAQTKVPVRISAYLPDDDQLDHIKAEIITVLQDLSREYPIPGPTFSKLVVQDWATAWQESYTPIPLGRNMIIVPSWLENPQPERLEIKIDPGMAFGSGTHPTTQLCLNLLERHIFENPIKRMIDIGCGSGILAIAGIKLGAGYVLGVDNDPDTIQVAGANANINLVGDLIDFRFGSLTEIMRGQFDINKANLVAANIIAPILIGLLEEGLDEIVVPGGSLLLSGILIEQLPGVLDLLKNKKMIVRNKLQEGDWIALQVDKPR